MDCNRILNRGGLNMNIENSETKYVVLKNNDGEIIRTFEGDEAIQTTFSEYRMLGVIDAETNARFCSIQPDWDKKVDFDENMNVIVVDKYSEEEHARLLAERQQQERIDFFNSEKRIALAIEEDYRLQLEDITDEQMTEVKTYMKSIQLNVKARMNVPRPEIMEIYKNRLLQY